ncbi:T9SS type A sorting domain-containing protein [bacterium]|nr:T9SS type A sorting domain-containing protein [bacterium]
MNPIRMAVAPCLLLVPALIAAPSRADVSVEMLGTFFGTSISADGTVLACNTQGTYEACRWTQATGLVPLGMSSVAVLGRGAGTPAISADGTRISATILGVDSTYVTQGLWTLGSGWQETMPPMPPDGGMLDEEMGSAWGLSDDGNTVVGLYWRLGQPDGSAHASTWTEGGNTTGLGGNGGSSRANDCSGDGSIVVGWAERFDGTWQPTVWQGDSLQTLTATEGFCEAHCILPDGSTIFGSTFELHSLRFSGAAWDWNGSSWVERDLGYLPGTQPNNGYIAPNDATPDGRLVVGYNQFFWGSSTGFVWTEETGMLDLVDFVEERGGAFPSDFVVTSAVGVSDDGSVIVGVGQDTVPPWNSRTFLVHIDGGVDAPELAEAMVSSPRIRAWPNPSPGRTRFSFDVPAPGQATATVFDAAGRKVRQIFDGRVDASSRELTWDGRDADGANVASGVYYLRLDGTTLRETGKFVVVR